MTDEAYTNFLQFDDESKNLGLRECNLEAIMNEVSFGVTLTTQVLDQRVARVHKGKTNLYSIKRGPQLMRNAGIKASAGAR